MNSTNTEDTDAARAEEMFKEDFATIQATVAGKDLQQVSAELQKELDLLENVGIDIAITGVPGAGKSSFVNALLGMDDDDDHAAKTGVKETTMAPTSYPYPPFPNLIIWDLPGIGTPNFEADKYLKQVEFDRYDFFILVTQDRFTENDIKLVREIKEMKKRFYCVRTKVDISIDSESRKKKFEEKETLEEIRKYCEESLEGAGETSPRVFLISRWEPEKYDFPGLIEQMQKDQDDIKRDAMAMFMPILTKGGLSQKKEAMEKYIWKLAFVSCAVGLFPIPGFSLVCDICFLVEGRNRIQKVFALDDKSINILANRVGKSVDELKSAVQNCPVVGKITPATVFALVERSFIWKTVSIVRLVLDSIPIVKSLTGGANGFLYIYLMLKNFLEDVTKDAGNVLAKAAEPKASK